MYDEAEQVRHFSVEFSDGATITLPAGSWLDQGLVRAMLTAVRGREPAWMSESDWRGFVFGVADRQEAS